MQIIIGGVEISLLPFAFVVLAVLSVILWRRKRSLPYLFCFVIFGIYLLFAIERVFFPIRTLETYGEATQAWFAPSINLIPFNFDFSFIPHIVLMQIFQNVLLTVPFGFGISFLVPVRARDMLWFAPVLGLGIEIIQLGISLLLRYPYRIIDINDVLLNALGVWLGYGIFRIFARLYVWAARRFAFMRRGFGAFILDVVQR